MRPFGLVAMLAVPERGRIEVWREIAIWGVLDASGALLMARRCLAADPFLELRLSPVALLERGFGT